MTNWWCWNKYLLIVVLTLGAIPSFAQNKYDANWGFGIKAGIDFNNPDTPSVFQTTTHNLEVAASISDSSGQLLLYLNANGNYNVPSSILNAQNEIVANGDSINTDFSCTNCALFIPTPSEVDQYILFHIGYYQISGCPYSACYHLYYTKIRKNELGEFEVYEKNISLLEEPVEEKLAAVKHANGIDWWIMIHKLGDGNSAPATNTFFGFLLKSDSLLVPLVQNIGTLHVNTASYSGEMTFSPKGNKLADAINGQNTIDLFSFNRCTGLLDNYSSISTGNIATYSVEFSPNGRVLYHSEGGFIGADLYQYDLKSSNIPSSQIRIWDNTSSSVRLGQLQLGPNGKIYLANTEGNGVSVPFSQSTQNIGIIKRPDSLGQNCNFEPFSFFLGDSTRSLLSLPNMPNYNLGPTSIYAADAGEDTVYCTNQSNGVTIGTPPVEHIIYAWYPSHHLSDTTIAQPIASPTKDTWYYLTVTDTTNTTSCHTRTDSVFVRVDSCFMSVYSPQSIVNRVWVYPNPANETVFVSIPGTHYPVRIAITDINGKEILQTTQTQISVSDLAKGLYFVRVELESGESVVKKVIIH